MIFRWPRQAVNRCIRSAKSWLEPRLQYSLGIEDLRTRLDELSKEITTLAKANAEFHRRLDLPDQTPALRAPSLIVHYSHHKTGTVWFSSLLKKIAWSYNLEFGEGISSAPEPRHDIYVGWGGSTDFPALNRDYVGSHMIRDPRDVIVSGYFYHKRTSEHWANIRLPHLNGDKYRERIASLSTEEGILFEMDHIGAKTIAEMFNWNYRNPHIIELKYEDVITRPEIYYKTIFRHYGFNDAMMATALRVADEVHLKPNATSDKGNSHVRSGKTGQWREYFTHKHKTHFKEKFPGVLETLGYEYDDNW